VIRAHARRPEITIEAAQLRKRARVIDAIM
jgi:hypothetical protein